MLRRRYGGLALITVLAVRSGEESALRLWSLMARLVDGQDRPFTMVIKLHSNEATRLIYMFARRPFSSSPTHRSSTMATRSINHARPSSLVGLF